MSAVTETLYDLLSFPVHDGGFGFTPLAEPELPMAQTIDFNETDTKPGTEPDAPNGTGLSPEENRRLRRMISNRESARRSRVRKQRHLEELHVEGHRLRSANRGMAGRLGTVRHCSILFRRDNERLRSESAALRRRLAEIRRVALIRSLLLQAGAAACGGFAAAGDDLAWASLMLDSLKGNTENDMALAV